MLTSYRIDAGTGRLQATSSQAMGDVHEITGDPQGRFVYMAYGPRWFDPPGNGKHTTLVAYAPAPADGTLQTVSEVTNYGIALSGQRVDSGWRSLSAGTDRIYGIWYTRTYHDDYYLYVTHPVDAGGELGAPYSYLFEENVGTSGFVDGRSSALYKQGSTGVTAHAVGPDGQFYPTGYSNLCGTSPAFGVTPLASARAFLFGRALLGFSETALCTFEGMRLAPRAHLGFDAAWIEAFVPHDEAAPIQVATPAPFPRDGAGLPRRELRLYALQPDGFVSLQAAVDTSDFVSRALFHPSGHFLFASVGTSLETYTFDSGGHLARVESLPDAAGRMAVTYTASR